MRKDPVNKSSITEDIEEAVVSARRPYGHFEHTHIAQSIHFYLVEEIGEAIDYVDMIHRLTSATENDVVYIHINCPGGSLDTGIQIINAMQNSEAKIVTIIEGIAASMGSLIFLAGDELVVLDNCMLMIHNFNGKIGGKGNELTSQLAATVKWFESMAKRFYIPFLTEEEVERVIRGEDFWMHSPEVLERLQNMEQILRLEQEGGIKKTAAEILVFDGEEDDPEGASPDIGLFE